MEQQRPIRSLQQRPIHKQERLQQSQIQPKINFKPAISNVVESQYFTTHKQPQPQQQARIYMTPVKHPEHLRTQNTEQSHFRSHSQFSTHRNKSIEMDTSRRLGQNPSTYRKPQSSNCISRSSNTNLIQPWMKEIKITE